MRRLKDDNEDLKGRLRSLERNYENVLVEMVGFQRGMAQQDGVMQNLIAYFLGSESGKSLSSSLSSASGSGLGLGSLPAALSGAAGCQYEVTTSSSRGEGMLQQMRDSAGNNASGYACGGGRGGEGVMDGGVQVDVGGGQRRGVGVGGGGAPPPASSYTQSGSGYVSY